MPATVSILELVKIPGTRALWPAELRAFEEKLEVDLDDPATWGAAADWCQEEGIDEQALGEAYRWVFKRIDKMPIGAGKETWHARWHLVHDNLPIALRGVVGYYDGADTIAGVMALLADTFRKVREEMF